VQIVERKNGGPWTRRVNKNIKKGSGNRRTPSNSIVMLAYDFAAAGTGIPRICMTWAAFSLMELLSNGIREVPP